MRQGTYVDLEVFVDVVVHDEAVCQADTVRLHGMASDIGIVANVRVVEVGDLLLRGRSFGVERAIAIDAGRVLGRCRVVHDGQYWEVKPQKV